MSFLLLYRQDLNLIVRFTELLDQMDRIKDAIVRETGTTGVLASRYRAGRE